MSVTVHLRCFRIFENERGFQDWAREYRFDGEFDTYEKAIIHMHEVCGWNSGKEGWTFDVEIEDRGWDE